MAARTTEVANPLRALGLQARIFHVSSIGIRARVLLLQRDQIAGDILRVLLAEPQTWHHGHVLDLQLVAIVRAGAVLEIELIRQAVLGVIFRPNVLLLIRTIRARALARVMDPADEVIEIVFLTHAGQVRSKGSALHLVALTN